MFATSRAALRRGVFNVVRRIGATEDARWIASKTLTGLLYWRPRTDVPPEADRVHLVYPEVGAVPNHNAERMRSDAIIITARYRSGSTHLWNIFRHIPGCTAYFEPFHHRRPFDRTTRGTSVSPTHRHVDDYWREYDGLELLDLYFDRGFCDRQLYMDADAWNPAMKRYVEILIERAPGRPVLQFNNIDLRLPWFRQHFPQATLIHLIRHPRDQWCSFLRNPAAFDRSATVASFDQHDHFFVRDWVADLRYHFPFLEWAGITHPYEMFYYLWKLSYLYGVTFADHTLTFEDLVMDPDNTLPLTRYWQKRG
jgi:hypothetical protein